MILQELRLRIDAIAKTIESNINQQKESKACIKSLYMAKAWTGKLLGELGSESPYKNDGKRNGVEDIEPTDAVSKSNPVAGLNYVQVVDRERQEIQQLIDLVAGLEITPKPTREQSICRTNIWNHLCEARFELGFLLQAWRP